MKNWIITRWRKLTAALAALLAGLGIVIAADPTYSVSLTLPTQYTDGSALPLSALTSYTVAYRVGSGAVATKVVNGPFVALNQNTTIPKNLGVTCASAFVNVGAVASAATADVCVTNTGPPMPPTGLAVQ